jgi:NAD(P)-dependent dehydrogenase (short-subunit alcohol dehydrogenase family)
MMNQQGKVILITGASSGIGRACALHLASLGHRVYGTSRRPQTEDTGCMMLQMDVTDDASVEMGIQILLEREGRIDVVVNNAGVGYGGSMEDTSIEEAKDTFETNFFGVLRVCRAALPAMRAQGSGTIINVSSIGGQMGLPYQGLYSASKYAVEGVTESLRMEVKRFGIHVVLLAPGDIRTQFTDNRRSTHAAETNPVYREQYLRTLKKIESDERGGASPEVVARAVARIIASSSPRLRYIVGPFYEKLAVLVRRIVPSALFERILMINNSL